MSPTPLIAVATAKAFKGPHESFMPKLYIHLQELYYTLKQTNQCIYHKNHQQKIINSFQF